jgi:hypothetical protein
MSCAEIKKCKLLVKLITEDFYITFLNRACLPLILLASRLDFTDLHAQDYPVTHSTPIFYISTLLEVQIVDIVN